MRPEGRTAPSTTGSGRPGAPRGACLRLKLMYRNADGLAVNEKEREFRNRVRDSNADIVGGREKIKEEEDWFS